MVSSRSGRRIHCGNGVSYWSSAQEMILVGNDAKHRSIYGTAGVRVITELCAKRPEDRVSPSALFLIPRPETLRLSELCANKGHSKLSTEPGYVKMREGIESDAKGASAANHCLSTQAGGKTERTNSHGESTRPRSRCAGFPSPAGFPRGVRQVSLSYRTSQGRCIGMLATGRGIKQRSICKSVI